MTRQQSARRRPTGAVVSVAVVALAALVASLAVAVLVPLLEGPVVGTRTELSQVPFGQPLTWLHQDQTHLDPTFPMRAQVQRPQEAPSDVSPGALVLDVVLGAAVLLAMIGAMVVIVRRVRRAPRTQRAMSSPAKIPAA